MTCLIFSAARGDRMIIDEVQRAPDLLLAIKAIVDREAQRVPGHFVLTGPVVTTSSMSPMRERRCLPGTLLASLSIIALCRELRCQPADLLVYEAED